jgi:hypothetical protein
VHIIDMQNPRRDANEGRKDAERRVACPADDLSDTLHGRHFAGEGGVPAGASRRSNRSKTKKVSALFGMGHWVLDKY